MSDPVSVREANRRALGFFSCSYCSAKPGFRCINEWGVDLEEMHPQRIKPVLAAISWGQARGVEQVLELGS